MRPKNPSFSVPVWAPQANYDASGNPWSASPTKVDHPGRNTVGFTPKAGVPAQAFNKLVSDMYATPGALKANLNEWADYVGTTTARSWMPFQTSLTNPCQVRFNAGIYFLSGISTVSSLVRCYSADAWTTSDEMGAAAVSPPAGTTIESNFDVAPDNSIVLPAGADVAECTSAGVWTKRSAVFAAALIMPDCIYDPVTSTWIVAGKRTGVGQADFYTSTNRTAWTARVAPASVPTVGTNGAYVTLGDDGAGTIVAQLFPDTYNNATPLAAVAFARSTNGGVTWSAATSKTVSFTLANTNGTHLPKPIWTGSKWVAFVANNANTKTYVYNSADGLSWTQVQVLTSAAIVSMAADGELLLAITSAGVMLYSVDGGVTWHLTGIKYSTGTNKRLFGVNGGFVLSDLTNSKIRHSFVAGDMPGAVAVT